MTGLELSRRYFLNVAAPYFKRNFPDVYDKAAAGLVGNGSECFGYDDVLSRDHDWGVDFFIWLAEGERPLIPKLAAWKMELFEKYPPEFSRKISEYGARIGVMTTGDFYESLVGFANGPETAIDWLRVPEENLAMSVNGTVFMDIPGDFTATRERLLLHYPEDVRRKKLAAKCMAIAQTGQYNLKRCYLRQDWVTYRTVLARFNDSVIGAVFLLNRVYRPYYKWSFRRMTELPILGLEVGSLLLNIVSASGTWVEQFEQNQADIDKICALLIDGLKTEKLTTCDDSFLATHGEAIQAGISDAFLRKLPAQYE